MLRRTANRSIIDPNDPVFVDVSLVESKKIVLDQIESAGLKLIPVVSQTDKLAYSKSIRAFERACLRLDARPGPGWPGILSPRLIYVDVSRKI